jgi:hypothetical protein
MNLPPSPSSVAYRAPRVIVYEVGVDVPEAVQEVALKEAGATADDIIHCVKRAENPDLPPRIASIRKLLPTSGNWASR